MTSQAVEEWRPVPNWERFYEVSDLGRVRRLPRTIEDSKGRTLSLRAKLLKGTETQSGHRAVGLTAKDNDPPHWTVFVHVLVLEAFVGPCPEGLVTCHWDGDPTNNRVENLRWDTRAANSQDAIRHGRTGASNERCRNGHPYTPENTSRHPASDSRPETRRCRICTRINNAKSKKRARANARIGNALLTADAVAVIRREYAAGDATPTELARRFEVAAGTVWNVIYEKSWNNVGAAVAS